jgi:hypothetical protein
MNLAGYLQNIFKFNNASQIKDVTNQGLFAKLLFWAAGSSRYKEKPSGCEAGEYEHKLYKGSRHFTRTFKEYFGEKIEREKLASFFDEKIVGINPLTNIMKNFGFFNDREPQTRKIFIDFLCTLFQMLLDSPSGVDIDYKEAPEYSQLAEKESPDTPLLRIANKNLAQDFQNLQNISTELRGLSTLIDEHDFISAPYPAQDLIFITDKLDELLPNMFFFDSEISSATKILAKKLKEFTDLISEITFHIDVRGNGYIRRGLGMLPIGVTFEDVEKETQERLLSLHKLIEKILESRERLQKEIKDITKVLVANAGDK